MYMYIFGINHIRKNSGTLGEHWKGGVPIEVIPLAYKPVINQIKRRCGGDPVLRLAKCKAVSLFE